MIKQGEQRLVPKLRFKGFSEDWEQCKLGELGKDYSGLTGKTKKDFGHGESLYVPYKNIFNNHIVDVDNLEKVNVSSKQNKVKYGDIFFTISSEVPEEVGMSSVIGKDINNLYLNSFSFGLRPYEKSELDMIFSSYLFRTLTFRKKMYILAQGISRYNISKANVMKLEIALPSVNEQKKIGRLLYKLDSMITLHNLKKEKIEKLKLDLVRRLDFSLIEESDEVVLGDLIEIKSGYGFKSEEFSNNGIPLVRISDIDSGIVKKPGTFIKEDSKYIDFLIKSGDYLIAMSGATTGKIGRYTLNHDAYCNQRIGIIRGIENKIDNNYLEYVLHSSKFQHYISTQWGAGAQPNINLKQIKDYKLRLPKLSEQKLIGSIFANLNRQKDIHKVEQLLSLKELYLNKLFI
ncbi:restriction endonuclease subunit S [Nosocomiicoccus massiliensis]|uniref:Restriction endonuclease subunit S n=1 Tax=Nosocomiicoccus massiliensis TaxID=1232430 RepID=A0AAF1BUT3_9STAP|nr:restriction endonuclease subunit S [Nosocomiicoccus massiliensis]WOS95466.1 restriction endonuclease subunit S [Nosocomiicoccus massiliensis]